MEESKSKDRGEHGDGNGEGRTEVMIQERGVITIVSFSSRTMVIEYTLHHST